MASVNKTFLLGNLTRDVELRHTPSGTAVADIGMAVNDRERVDGEWQDVATFVDVTLWGRNAEVADEFLSKGSPVHIEGRLKLDTWEDKEGNRRSKIKVIAERLTLVGGRGGGSSNGDGYSEPAGSYKDQF